MSGECVLGAECAGYDKRSGAAQYADRALCLQCEADSQRDIRLLPYDYVDLSQIIAKSGGMSDTKIARPKPESAPPIDIEIYTLRAGIAWTLAVWEPVVRYAAGLPQRRPAPVREGWLVDAVTTVLVPRIQLLAALPPTMVLADGPTEPASLMDGAGAVWTLRSLHRRARAAVGLTKRSYRLPGDCAKCGAVALRRDDGSDTVHCGHCQGRWSVEDYRRWVSFMVTENLEQGP